MIFNAIMHFERNLLSSCNVVAGLVEVSLLALVLSHISHDLRCFRGLETGLSHRLTEELGVFFQGNHLLIKFKLFHQYGEAQLRIFEFLNEDRAVYFFGFLELSVSLFQVLVQLLRVGTD